MRPKGRLLRGVYGTLCTKSRLKRTLLLGVACAMGVMLGLGARFVDSSPPFSIDAKCAYTDEGTVCSPHVDKNVNGRIRKTGPPLKTNEPKVNSGPISRIEQRSNFRLAYMRSECDRFYNVRQYDPDKEASSLWALRRHMAGALSNDDYNLTVFTVMKVGSWHWNGVFESLHKKASPEYRRLHPKALDALSDAAESLYLKRLRTHYKVLFVRHPLVRIVSAWRNKFVENHSQWYRPWAKRMVRMFRKDPKAADMVRPTPTILEFVRYITESGDNEVHWKPVWQFYRPCRLGVDFLGRLETVDGDSAFVLSRTGTAKGATYQAAEAKRRITDLSLVRDHLANVPQEIFQRLVRKYEEDFRLFGYHMPSNVSDIRMWANQRVAQAEEAGQN